MYLARSNRDMDVLERCLDIGAFIARQCLSQHCSFLSSLERATLFVMASMITHKSCGDVCAVHRGFRFLQAHLLRFPNSVGTNQLM